MQPPNSCKNMTELRAAIDILDAELIELLASRAVYIDRAIYLKSQEGLPARIDARVENVVMRVRETAKEKGLDPELAEGLWRQLIEWSIAREEEVLGQ